MGTDQIREKPLGLELFRCSGTSLGTDDLGFRLHHKGVNPLGVSAIEAVTKMAEALGHSTLPIQRMNAKGHQLMLPLLCQTLNDMDVLPWEVLMNEENPH